MEYYLQQLLFVIYLLLMFVFFKPKQNSIFEWVRDHRVSIFAYVELSEMSLTFSFTHRLIIALATQMPIHIIAGEASFLPTSGGCYAASIR